MRGQDMEIDSLLDEVRVLREKGFNCSESSVWVLSKYWDLDVSTATVTAFGGGIGRTGEMCGALVGALAALSAYVGRVDPEDAAGKEQAYALARDAIARFRNRMGKLNCREIIGFVLGDQGGSEKYHQGGFKTRECEVAIYAAVRAAVEAVQTDIRRPDSA